MVSFHFFYWFSLHLRFSWCFPKILLEICSKRNQSLAGAFCILRLFRSIWQCREKQISNLYLELLYRQSYTCYQVLVNILLLFDMSSLEERLLNILQVSWGLAWKLARAGGYQQNKWMETFFHFPLLSWVCLKFYSCIFSCLGVFLKVLLQLFWLWMMILIALGTKMNRKLNICGLMTLWLLLAVFRRLQKFTRNLNCRWLRIIVFFEIFDSQRDL